MAARCDARAANARLEQLGQLCRRLIVFVDDGRFFVGCVRTSRCLKRRRCLNERLCVRYGCVASGGSLLVEMPSPRRRTVADDALHDDADQLDDANVSIEEVAERDVLYYRTYLAEQPHENYMSKSDDGSPLLLSLATDGVALDSSRRSFKALLRTKRGDVRLTLVSSKTNKAGTSLVSNRAFRSPVSRVATRREDKGSASKTANQRRRTVCTDSQSRRGCQASLGRTFVLLVARSFANATFSIVYSTKRSCW